MTDRGPALRTLVTTLCLMLSYALLGVASMLLAAPRGYASPAFPSAGVALVAVLLLGGRAWSGIWLGSFALNLWLAQTQQPNGSWQLAWQMPVVAGVIATGAVLQAWLGERLVRWRVPDIRLLHRPQDLFWLLLLGGPVACLVAASIGSSALRIGHAISTLQWLQSWATWWIGDTIGVLLVTPLLLMFRPGSYAMWRRRRIPMLLVLLSALSLIAVSVFSINQQERASAEAEFIRLNKLVEQAITDRLHGYQEYVNAVAHYVQVTDDLDSDNFTAFVKDLYLRYPGIRAMSWVPMVPAAQRSAFEHQQAAAGLLPAGIYELDRDGNSQPAGQREFYFPVQIIAPERGNDTAVGFDIGSEPQRRETLLRAIKVGQMQASGWLALVQQKQNTGGILMAHPVYRADGSLRGLVTGIFSLAQMAEPARVLAVNWGVAAELRDLDSTQQQTVLMARTLLPSTGGAMTLQQSSLIAWAGRQYLLDSEAADSFVSGSKNWDIWLMMAAGLVLASLIEALVLAFPNSGNDDDAESSLLVR